MNKNILLAGMMGMLAHPSFAQKAPVQNTDSTATSALDSVGIMPDQTLHEVQVVSRKPGMMRMKGAMNGQIISQDELFKAACWPPQVPSRSSCSDSVANTCRCSPRTSPTSVVPQYPIP